jgi:hypothetical protein
MTPTVELQFTPHSDDAVQKAAQQPMALERLGSVHTAFAQEKTWPQTPIWT